MFRIDLSEFGIGTGRVVFSREPGAGTRAVHLDLVPMSLQKRPATSNPRLWLNGALAVAATGEVRMGSARRDEVEQVLDRARRWAMGRTSSPSRWWVRGRGTPLDLTRTWTW